MRCPDAQWLIPAACVSAAAHAAYYSDAEGCSAALLTSAGLLQCHVPRCAAWQMALLLCRRSDHAMANLPHCLKQHVAVLMQAAVTAEVQRCQRCNATRQAHAQCCQLVVRCCSEAVHFRGR